MNDDEVRTHMRMSSAFASRSALQYAAKFPSFETFAKYLAAPCMILRPFWKTFSTSIRMLGGNTVANWSLMVSCAMMYIFCAAVLTVFATATLPALPRISVTLNRTIAGSSLERFQPLSSTFSSRLSLMDERSSDSQRVMSRSGTLAGDCTDMIRFIVSNRMYMSDMTRPPSSGLIKFPRGKAGSSPISHI